MNYAANILVALVIATTAACVDGPIDPESKEHVVLVRAYHATAAVNAPESDAESGVEFDGATEWDQLSDPDGDTEDSLCACDTNECAQAWIEENYGCDICVLAPCGDDGPAAGGCVACGPQQATMHQQASKVQLDAVN